MIGFTNKGNFNSTREFLNNKREAKIDKILTTYGEIGVSLLRQNTPVKTGKTASSWRYEIDKSDGKSTVNFINDNVVDYVNIAIILQHGHATRNGGYVQGRDYINPALQPMFDMMAENMWEAVVSI